MSAGRFVGRVGGLAVALGIGIAAHGAPVAWAQTGDDGARAGQSDSSSAPARAHRSDRSTVDGAVGGGSAAPGSSATAPAQSVQRADSDSIPAPIDVPEAELTVAPESLPDNEIQSEPVAVAAADPEPAAASPEAVVAGEATRADLAVQVEVPDATPAVFTAVPEAPVAVPAPADAVGGVVTTVERSAFDPFAGLGDLIPTESPLSWALLAAARRSAAGRIDRRTAHRPGHRLGNLRR